MWKQIIAVATGAALLAGCGTPESTANGQPLPTAVVRLATPDTAPQVRFQPTAAPTASLPTALPPTAEPTATPAPTDELGQYRAWIEEARGTHPYAETSDQMWAVMLCESSGNPQAASAYYGLFQYSPATWAGEWNPYRDQSIFDPRAQIFATAKAWSDGHQGWWGCYR